MGVPSMPELLIILAIVVLLFGAKKIPDLAKGIGKGIKSFKSEMKEDEIAENKADEKIEKKEETTSADKVEDTKQA
ncbi:twin-arginine translocase TatA/TatE family subunit [Sulfurospirillum arcachonense]|uniref:twin-arginine translocase TatA/TatE family subunit n=1 Tax=Sulfurospirillum arcachonense TaxID=57666 RepID=UPI00046882EA|nr:twin-arginine translocase TatA/TatE family subunit [Sulfurospirillum arcachonense]